VADTWDAILRDVRDVDNYMLTSATKAYLCRIIERLKETEKDRPRPYRPPAVEDMHLRQRALELAVEAWDSCHDGSVIPDVVNIAKAFYRFIKEG
jgi:hypothetical protein